MTPAVKPVALSLVSSLVSVSRLFLSEKFFNFLFRVFESVVKKKGLDILKKKEHFRVSF